MSSKPIIAATDFSAASERAVRRAALLAAAHATPLHLVTVLPANWIGELRQWLAGADLDASDADVEARLQRLVGDLQRHGAPAIDAHVREGDPRAELVRHAEEVGAQLLVVGSHGRSLAGEIALGSTALALLGRAGAPVLLVRRAVDQPYRSMLAGVAFEDAARTAIRFAAALLPDADLTLAHVYHDPFAAELFLGQASEETEAFYRERARSSAQQHFDRFVAELGDVGTRAHRRLIYGPPGLRLTHCAAQLATDLVVLGAQRKSRLDRALLGSVTASVAMMVGCDVLLVREAERR